LLGERESNFEPGDIGRIFDLNSVHLLEVIMEIRFTAKNLNLSDRFRDYVSEKSNKVEQFAHRPEELNIKVTRYEHNRHAGQEDAVELTVYEPGNVIRAEARASDKFAAFDIAFQKLVERLRRYSDRQKVHRGGQHQRVGVSELAAEGFARLDITPVDHDVLTGEIPIVEEAGLLIREKQFKREPMTRQHAVDQMELVGHDFYLFFDSESNQPSVVYRRKGYSYGVISLKD
jgi:ribosomal subunit interface protein